MIDMLKKSRAWRFFSSIIDIYKNGSIAKFFNGISRFYGVSKSKLLLDRFVSCDDSVKSSILSRFLDFCGKKTATFGLILKNSIFQRMLDGIAAFASRLTQNSFIGHICRYIGFRGFLIMLFALYLPIDFVLREVLEISLIASLWDDAFMLFGAMYVFYRRALRRAPLGSRVTSLDLFIAMFIAVGFLLMCITSPNMGVAISGYRAQVQYILWFFIIVRLIEDDKDFKIFFGTLLFMASVIALHGIYQFIIVVPIPSSWVSQTEEAVRTRVFSITGSPNILGSFIVMFAPLMASVAYYSKQLWVKICALGLTGIMCLCCLFTFSKGAWFGLILAVAVFAILLDKRVIALMAVVGGAAVALVPSIASRITYLFTSDYREASLRAGRMIRWEKGLELLHEGNSWLGFGLGRFGGAVAMQNKLIEETDTFSYFYMDNYYLKTMVEMGYVGLIFYVIMLFGLIKTGLKAVGRVRKSEVYPLAVGIFSGLCGVLLHCYFENIFEVSYMMAYFWALAASLVYLGFFRKKGKA